MHTDPRIDPARLAEKRGVLPDDPQEQNRLWYRIYKQHGEEPGVIDAHQGFLLARDLTALSVVFLIVFGPLALVFATGASVALFYVGALSTPAWKRDGRTSFVLASGRVPQMYRQW